MSTFEKILASIKKYKIKNDEIFVLLPYHFKDDLLKSISNLGDDKNNYHYGIENNFAVIDNTVCKFVYINNIVFVRLNNENLDDKWKKHIDSYQEFLKNQNILNKILDKIINFSRDVNKFDRIYVAIPLKYRDELFREVLALHPESGPKFYVMNDERFARIGGAICDFKQEYDDIFAFIESDNALLDSKYISMIEDFKAECRQNAKDYRNMLRNEFYEKRKGETITIEVSKLFELAGFLIASSHYEDMGRMPYPHFQNIAHRLGHELSEMIGECRTVNQTSYDIFDSLKEK